MSPSPSPAPPSAPTSRPLTLADRLRIEVAVWRLDTKLGELPRRSRIAHRKETRANLRAAALDVGSAKALRLWGSKIRVSACELYLCS